MNTKCLFKIGVVIAVLFVMTTSLVFAQETEGTSLGTAFTYAGMLKVSSENYTGNCDFQFALYDALESGSQVGTNLTLFEVLVNEGLFTVQLDFGSSIFTGDARWLEICVRCPAGGGNYTQLTPRQALTPTPYALALPGLWTQMNVTSPNLIGGYNGNIVTSGVVGATIGGGGELSFLNKVTDNFATVGGGKGNRAGNDNENLVDAAYATIAGGISNTASGDYTAIGGGDGNLAGGGYATIGGGRINIANGYHATISGGESNEASGSRASVGGGTDNNASNNYTTIGGGFANNSSGLYATIGGGHTNTASNHYATIAGGNLNTASGQYATVPGGWNNLAAGNYSFAAGYRAKANHPGSFVWADYIDQDFASTGSNQFLVRATGGVNLNIGSGGLRLLPYGTNLNLIGGYSGNWITPFVYGAVIAGGGDLYGENRVTDNYGSIGGGYNNQAGDSFGTTNNAQYATIGGGQNNTASGNLSTIGGGLANNASGESSIIGGGEQNIATGENSTIIGGIKNEASGNNSTVSGGYENIASGSSSIVGGGSYNIAGGGGSMIVGGAYNETSGSYSFAAGYKAIATHNDSFVWGNSSFPTESWGDGTFTARAAGGVRFYTASSGNTIGAQLAGGSGSWSSLSDQHMKYNIVPVDSQQILENVVSLPVSTWSYISQDDSIRHMGPMAQDFYAAFGLGEDEHYIGSLDADGVALAAIQGLYAENQKLQVQVDSLLKDKEDMESRLAQLEETVNVGNNTQSGISFNLPLLLAFGLVALGGNWVVRKRMNGEQ